MDCVKWEKKIIFTKKIDILYKVNFDLFLLLEYKAEGTFFPKMNKIRTNKIKHFI